MGVLNKLIDFGFEHIDIWRSEPMSLAQVGSFHGSQSIKGPPTHPCILQLWMRMWLKNSSRFRCIFKCYSNVLYNISCNFVVFFPLKLMIPAESAHDTIEALGDVGLLEFKDLNPDKSAFQRSYASQVRL